VGQKKEKKRLPSETLEKQRARRTQGRRDDWHQRKKGKNSVCGVNRNVGSWEKKRTHYRKGGEQLAQ